MGWGSLTMTLVHLFLDLHVHMYIYTCTFVYRYIGQSFKEENLADIKNCLTLVVKSKAFKSR